MAAENVRDIFTARVLQVASAEFTGTFFLAFFIGSNTVSGELAPYAIGFGLIAMIYVFAGISGAQFNPAVSWALYLCGCLSIFELFYCVTSQLLGATFAGLMSYALYENQWKDVGYPEVDDKNRRPQAFAAEMTLTFCLIWSVLTFAKSKELAHNSFYGMTFGFIVMAGALVIATVSGACFNPAVAMLTLLHGDFYDLWVFALGPMAGATFAALLYRWMPTFESWSKMLPKLIVEFIGTFYVTWIVALTSNSAQSNGFLAAGFMTAGMTYTVRHVSGGYINPCVTFAVYLRGMYDRDRPQLLLLVESLSYVAVQFLAAFAATGVAEYVNDGIDKVAYPSVDKYYYTDAAALIIQFIFAFALVTTVLHTATNAYYIKHDDYFGIAIGFVVVAVSLSYGDVAGGVINPAIATALSLVTKHNEQQLWIYWVGDFGGAALASLMYYVWWGTYGHNRAESRDEYGHRDQDLPYSRTYSRDGLGGGGGIGENMKGINTDMNLSNNNASSALLSDFYSPIRY